MSKTEAQAIADRLRSDIRTGKLTDAGTALPDTGLTFGDVVERYVERHVRVPTRRPAAQQVMEWHLGVLRRARVPAAGDSFTCSIEEVRVRAVVEPPSQPCVGWSVGGNAGMPSWTLPRRRVR